MHFRVTCTSCGGTTTVSEDLLGSSLPCARCGHPIQVPAVILDRDLTVPSAKPFRRSRPWWQTLGVWAVCCAAFAAVALIPLLLARHAHRARPDPTQPDTLAESTAVGTDGAAGVAGKQPSVTEVLPAEEPPLVAGRGGFSCEGIQADVSAAELGTTRVYDARGNPYTDYSRTLKIWIRLENRTENGELTYDGFREDPPTLKDGSGYTYRVIAYPPGQHAEGQQPDGATLYPRKPLRDCVLFEKPRDKVGMLVLEIPRKPLGGRGTQKILIPREMIKSLEPAR